MTVARSHSNGGDEKTTNLARKVGHEVDDLVRDNEDEDRAGTHSELLEVDARRLSRAAWQRRRLAEATLL